LAAGDGYTAIANDNCIMAEFDQILVNGYFINENEVKESHLKKIRVMTT
jgi:hypothetical protein